MTVAVCGLPHRVSVCWTHPRGDDVRFYTEDAWLQRRRELSCHLVAMTGHALSLGRRILRHFPMVSLACQDSSH